ncbi:polysaccharide pyruvyl transferase family protein [Halomonas sp. N3-2A]|uniref:polysaccharide pyruvyl transferase family protein n=1 Tax=Halomonas sp. N3-2A TaxID=2014541 RepID=UPI000B5B4862|nr:polysaccharide pyruvyl transferase family protein [Halomonas sp. N3-2A]ASK18008.1 hypothetical protein CEK60_01245 [Halomonas sp. N3-2A]
MPNSKVYAHITAKNHPAGNLGDKMGYLIADKLLGSSNYKKLGIRDIDFVDEATFAIVGSLLQVLASKPVNVIGGGLINSNPRKYHNRIKIHGVRGFLTKALILRDAGIDVPVIGDPGLLLSNLYPLPCNDKKPLGFIVHKVDRDKFLKNFPHFESLIIDNYLEPEGFVKQLSKYSSVASTSLHGCVFCHSYGIPVKPFYLTDEVIGGDFKFMDYYSSLGLDVRREYLDEINSEVDFVQKIIDSPQPGYGFIERLKKKQIDLIERVMFESSEK